MALEIELINQIRIASLIGVLICILLIFIAEKTTNLFTGEKQIDSTRSMFLLLLQAVFFIIIIVNLVVIVPLGLIHPDQILEMLVYLNVENLYMWIIFLVVPTLGFHYMLKSQNKEISSDVQTQ